MSRNRQSDVQRFDGWFKERVKGFMFHDIQTAICGKANFLAALGLLSYTEVLGGMVTGQWGSSKIARNNFNTFLKRMGPNYERLLVSGVDVCQLFRSELAHRYFLLSKGVVAMGGTPGTSGLEVLEASTGGHYIVVRVSTYFEDFRRAAEECHQQVMSGLILPPRLPWKVIKKVLGEVV